MVEKDKKATLYNNLEKINITPGARRQPEKFGPLAKFGFMPFEALKEKLYGM